MTTPQPTTFDFLVFIGRFQPFHNGHLMVIHEGLKKAERLLILCGSSHQPRSTRNPFTFEEREQMLRNSLSDADNLRIDIAPLMDIVYNDESWVSNVQATIKGLVTARHGRPHLPPKVGLIGHSKDHSSYYLNLFPQWDSVNVENKSSLSATPLREAFFSNDTIADTVKENVPNAITQYLEQFKTTEAYQLIKYEQDFVLKYKQAWQKAPYSPTFVTVDALVIQSGHVLLVKRRARPGQGLYALPGGFLDQSETLIDACLRELREETRLKIPTPVLKGSIKNQRVFDDPHRSARGRTITHVFYIELEPNQSLPKVKGSDDAEKAFWLPLAELNPKHMFEDHYFIIKELTGL